VQRRARGAGGFFVSVVQPKIYTAFFPASERETSEPQPHFAGLRRGMHRYGLRSHGDYSFHLRPRSMQQSFRFAVRNEPAIQVDRLARVDPFERAQRRFLLVKFHRELRVERCDAMRNGTSGLLGENQAKPGDCSLAPGVAYACQPE
jgi:hypothetical protein